MKEVLDNNPQKETREFFLKRIKDLEQDDIKNIDMAYDLAKEGHRIQTRDSGERYFEHVRSVAIILIDECKILDPDLIISALLHDTVEDSPIFGNSTQKYSIWKETVSYRLTKIFNSKVAKHVITLTKPKIDGEEIVSKQQASQIYMKNLESASPETILIKMCDRLHNTRTLHSTTPEKQARKAKETIEEYFPLFKSIEPYYPTQYHYLKEQIDIELNKLNK